MFDPLLNPVENTRAQDGTPPSAAASPSPFYSEWSRGISLGHVPSVPRVREEIPFSSDDLAAVQTLFARVTLPWRLFLANSAFEQISIPEIAKIVSLSKRYAINPRERIEATRTFLKTIILEGPDSPAGEAAIARVNQIHTEMSIDPLLPEFSFVIYTLSRGLAQSLTTYGGIRPTPREELALFHLMRRVAEKMGATNIPRSYAEFIASCERFRELRWQNHSDTSREVAQSLLLTAFSNSPAFARPLLSGFILSLVESDVLMHLGITPPSLATRIISRATIKLLRLGNDLTGSLLSLFSRGDDRKGR